MAWDYDAETIRDITFDDIEACDAEGALNRWHALAHDLYDDLLAQITVRNAAGTSRENDWLFRASTLAQAMLLAMKRIERRALRLGFEPIVSRDGQERATIRALKGQLRAAQKRIRDLEGTPEQEAA